MHRHVVTTPDFPHGEERGYCRGCACEPCRAAHSAAEKRRHIRRGRGELSPKTSVPLAGQVRAHMDVLTALPLVSIETVAAAAAVNRASLRNACSSTCTSMAAGVAARVLAVTAAQALAHRFHVPAEPYKTKIRQLQAAGWGLKWQCDWLGVKHLNAVKSHTTRIEARTATRIDRMVTQVGIVLATPANSGQPQWVINRARREAQRLGYYPPGCYNDDGTLDVRAIPGHPWSKADERAGRNLEIVRDLIDGRLNHADIATRHHTNIRLVGRVATDAGLVATNPNQSAAVAAITTGLAAYDDGDDPVTVALRLNLIESAPYDHPGHLAWLAECAAATSAAHAPLTRPGAAA